MNDCCVWTAENCDVLLKHHTVLFKGRVVVLKLHTIVFKGFVMFMGCVIISKHFDNNEAERSYFMGEDK